MRASRSIVFLGTVSIGACGFHPNSNSNDGSIVIDSAIDAPPDGMTATNPHSCKEIHGADATKPSGNYLIDPDGAGGDAPLTVVCDMTTDDGGWTLVFTAPANVATPPAYTSSTPRLLADATSALIAYRDNSLSVVDSFAVFAMPPDWRTATPFAAANTDLVTNVRIDSDGGAMRTLRYGYQSFADTCDDAWITNETQFGRLCVRGTTGPFFSGFASALADECSASDVSWDTTACTTSRKFTIAVR